ncbi:hypothetical protein TNCV_4289081 [Trichonephila clavipes]|nr:hypothetical protein TNCV_4289081 [Trichonephila clavipes]
MSAVMEEQPNMIRRTAGRGEFNTDSYQRIVAVYCLGQTSFNSWCKSFREEQQMISDLHENIHPHVSCETKAALKKSAGKCYNTHRTVWEELAMVGDDKVCTAPIMADKGILEFD